MGKYIYQSKGKAKEYCDIIEEQIKKRWRDDKRK